MERDAVNPGGSVPQSKREPTRKKSPSSSSRIRLSVGDSVIVVDKQRLTEISPYFASLHRFHADDSLQTVSLVPPENADLDCFLAVLYSLASTNVKLNISARNLKDYIVLSEYFQVEQTKDECLTALREMLPTLTMDDLLPLWRNGQALATGKVAELAVVGISLKMESASQSEEFLGLSTDELVALMSDDRFLPLTEKDACKAVKSWCDHDPDNRKQEQVLQRVLAELVWDEFTEHLIKSISRQYQKPDTKPKRMVNSESYKIPDAELLEEACASDGIIVGNFLYCLENKNYAQDEGVNPCFCRIDLKSKECERCEAMCCPEVAAPDDPRPEYSLCFVQLADRDKIGCFVSYRQRLQFLWDAGYAENVVHAIGLYDIVTDKWLELPCFPLSRIGCAMIQCGSFLYVIGGKEYQPLDEFSGANSQHCYRLNLAKFAYYQEKERDWEETRQPEEDQAESSEREEDQELYFARVEAMNTEWERIADLNAPRIQHSVKLQHGRIIVYGGQTSQSRARGISGRHVDVSFEEARWSEAYDPMLNCWTIFGSSS